MLALIVAHDKNRVIGNKGVIPWNLKDDKKYFRDLTIGNYVIMGRRTYEEIGHPLPMRTTIVISNTKNFDSDNCYTAKSLTEALKMAAGKDIFIAGGYRLYKEAIDLVDRMYITEIDSEFEGDTYFPEFDKSLFDKTIIRTVSEEFTYTYVIYQRKARKINV